MDQMVGLINVGRYHPRQLLITADGQIFGGTLKKQTLDLQLSSGQVTQIPLGQISRAGYRRRRRTRRMELRGQAAGDDPGRGARGIQIPTSPVEMVTRYGKLALGPERWVAWCFRTRKTGCT